MSFDPTNPVVVGAATKKDHYDLLFNNILHVYYAMKAGLPFVFGGNENQGNYGTGYPSGAGADKVVPGTPFLYVPDCSVFAGLTIGLEAMLKVESGGTETLCLVDLSAPDTALANSEITSIDATGERKRTTTAIAMPVSGAKSFGVKQHSAHASAIGVAWAIRLFAVEP